MLCKNEVPACKRADLAMFWMCSEVPSKAQFSCVHNKLLAWSRNDLAMMLISLWSLDISLDQALGTLLESRKLHRGIGTRMNERVNEVKSRATKESPQNENLYCSYLIIYIALAPVLLSLFLFVLPSFLSPCLSAVIGALSAAAALSPYLFPHLPPHSLACAVSVLLDRRFVCRCCLVFSPTKRNIATTSIDSNPQVSFKN